LYAGCIVILEETLTTVINPAHLIGLNQATYLMDSLVRGRSKQEIIDSWGGRAVSHDVDIIPRT